MDVDAEIEASNPFLAHFSAAPQQADSDVHRARAGPSAGQLQQTSGEPSAQVPAVNGSTRSSKVETGRREGDIDAGQQSEWDKVSPAPSYVDGWPSVDTEDDQVPIVSSPMAAAAAPAPPSTLRQRAAATASTGSEQQTQTERIPPRPGAFVPWTRDAARSRSYRNGLKLLLIAVAIQAAVITATTYWAVNSYRARRAAGRTVQSGRYLSSQYYKPTDSARASPTALPSPSPSSPSGERSAEGEGPAVTQQPAQQSIVAGGYGYERIGSTDQAAIGDNFPYLIHGPGHSISACLLACSIVPGCRVVNWSERRNDCVLRDHNIFSSKGPLSAGMLSFEPGYQVFIKRTEGSGAHAGGAGDAAATPPTDLGQAPQPTASPAEPVSREWAQKLIDDRLHDQSRYIDDMIDIAIDEAFDANKHVHQTDHDILEMNKSLEALSGRLDDLKSSADAGLEISEDAMEGVEELRALQASTENDVSDKMQQLLQRVDHQDAQIDQLNHALESVLDNLESSKHQAWDSISELQMQKADAADVDGVIQVAVDNVIAAMDLRIKTAVDTRAAEVQSDLASSQTAVVDQLQTFASSFTGIVQDQQTQVNGLASSLTQAMDEVRMLRETVRRLEMKSHTHRQHTTPNSSSAPAHSRSEHDWQYAAESGNGPIPVGPDPGAGWTGFQGADDTRHRHGVHEAVRAHDHIVADEGRAMLDLQQSRIQSHMAEHAREQASMIKSVREQMVSIHRLLQEQRGQDSDQAAEDSDLIQHDAAASGHSSTTSRADAHSWGEDAFQPQHQCYGDVEGADPGRSDDRVEYLKGRHSFTSPLPRSKQEDQAWEGERRSSSTAYEARASSSSMKGDLSSSEPDYRHAPRRRGTVRDGDL